MKIIVVEPSKCPYTKEIDGTLESMQEVVKGLIEPIYLEDDLVIIVNEEGKILRLPPNRLIFNNYFKDIICGTFFICLAPADSENFKSIPDELIKEYLIKFTNTQIRI